MQMINCIYFLSACMQANYNTSQTLCEFYIQNISLQLCMVSFKQNLSVSMVDKLGIIIKDKIGQCLTSTIVYQ